MFNQEGLKFQSLVRTVLGRGDGVVRYHVGEQAGQCYWRLVGQGYRRLDQKIYAHGVKTTVVAKKNLYCIMPLSFCWRGSHMLRCGMKQPATALLDELVKHRPVG